MKRATHAVKSAMYGSSSSFGSTEAGPAATWITRTPFIHSTISGSASASRRVNTSTS